VRTLVLADASTLLSDWPWNCGAVLAQTTTTSAPAGPVIDLKGPQAIALVIAIGLGIAIMWVVPFWMDARRAYRLRDQAIKLIGGQLLEAARKNGLTVTELRELLGTIGEPATGQRGLTRALMAFTIITIVGVALIAVLLSSSSDASDLRKTIITSLLAVLATIVGFYFGTRAAETAAEATTTQAPKPQEPASSTPVSDSTAPAPAGVDGTDAAGEERTSPVEEAGIPSVDEEDPEEQGEAGLSGLTSQEIEALNEQAAAQHGQPQEIELEDDETLQEEDLLSVADDEPEDEQGGS
jgi:hypothetical protein